MNDSSPQQVLKQFLQLRQLVLNNYWLLLELCPYQQQVKHESSLQSFCQSLIDYTSIGHFQAYEILFDNERKNTEKEFADKYDLLLQTTDVILEFNDKYENHSTDKQQKACFSTIGEALAKRMEIEDWLIEKLPLPDKQPEIFDYHSDESPSSFLGK